jgi:hypothetical protein
MKIRIGIAATAIALLTTVPLPASAMAKWPNSRDHYRGVPAPIVGAGLPILCVGYGVYWLVRRRRRRPEWNFIDPDSLQCCETSWPPHSTVNFERADARDRIQVRKLAGVQVRSDKSIASRSMMRIANELRRGEYFAGLFVLGCANGLVSRIVHSTWADAISTTFGISAIVWVSCTAGVFLILRDRTPGVRLVEIGLGLALVFLVLLPTGALSWVGVTGLSIYILLFTDNSSCRRGASILLATTVPMLWSRMLFHFFANPILAADASLVSWLLGTHRTGNLVEFADGSGELVIFPSCSSLANVSLAFLCWVALSELVTHRKSSHDLLWCLLACVAVIAVNVSRMAILGESEANYLAFHNQWGDSVVNVIILGLIVGISVLGVRRELFQRI